MATDLQNLYFNLLESNDLVRENSNKLLIEFSCNYPDNFLEQSLILYENTNSAIDLKKVILVTLNTIFDFYSNKNNTSLYLKLSLEKREIFKNKLIYYLKNETNKMLKNSITNIIADFSSSFFYTENLEKFGIDNNNKWPNLKNELIEIYKTGNEDNIISVLRIMSSLYGISDHYFKDNISESYYLIQNSLESNNKYIKYYAMNLLLSIVEGTDPKNFKVLKNLVKNYLINLKIILESKDETLILDSVNTTVDILDRDPNFFSEYVNDLFILVQLTIENKNIENFSGFKELMIDILLKLLRRYKSKFKKEDSFVNNTILMILYNMSQLEEENIEEWNNPMPGFLEENEINIDNIKWSLDHIYNLLEIFERDFVLKRLSLNIEKFMDKNNWKNIYACLMSLSEIGEFLYTDIKSVEPILNLISNYINNDNPKLRYVCLYVLEKYSLVLSPHFQELYFVHFMKLIENVINDKIPRVLSQCLYTLSNFIEHLKYDQKKDYFMNIYNKLIQYINVNSTLVQESSILCLSILIKDGKNLTISIEKELMEILIKIIKNLKEPHYKKLKSIALECCTILGLEIKKENFMKYFNIFTEIMIYIQINEISDEVNMNDDELDPDSNNFIKSYVLKSWKNLIEISEENLIPYIDKIIPNLINKSIKKTKASNKLVLCYNTYEAIEATETLALFLEKLGKYLIPYLDDLYKLIIELIDFKFNENVRSKAIELLIPFIKILKMNNNLNQNMLKQFIEKILKIMDEESLPDVLQKQGMVIQEIFNDNNNFLNENELQNIFEKFIYYLKEIDGRKLINNKLNNGDDEENNIDLEDFLEYENSNEEEWGCCIADIFGKIFKSHKKNSLFIADKLFNEYIENSIKPNNRPKIIKFGLFLIDDIIDYLGEFLPEEKLNLLWKILTNFSNHNNLEVRHAAVYGLGSISYQLKDYPCIMESLELLYKSYNTPLDNFENEEDYKGEHYLVFKDNATSAFGKILKKFSNKFNSNDLNKSINFWYNNMPIVNDKEESILQNEFFCDILVQNEKLLNGKNNENLNMTIKKLLLLYNEEEISNQKINKFIEDYFMKNKNIIINYTNFNEIEILKLKKIII